MRALAIGLVLSLMTTARAEPICIDHPELQLVAQKRAAKIGVGNRLRIAGGLLVGVGGLFGVIGIALGVRSLSVDDHRADQALSGSIGVAGVALSVGVPLLITGAVIKSHAENPATVFTVVF